MEVIAFRPNRLKYLVLPDEVKGEHAEAGGFRITQEKDATKKATEGTVKACGKDCSEYAVGMKVLYGQYSGYKQVLDGIEYVILAESEMLGEHITTPFDEDADLTEQDRRDRNVFNAGGRD